jgi:hypothetical protein
MPRLYGNLPIPPKSFLQRIPVPAPAIGKGKGRAVAGEEITIFPRNIRFQSKDFMADLSDVHEKYDVILAYGFFLCFSEENAEIRYSVDYPSQNGSIYITSRLACCPSSQRSTLHSLRKGFWFWNLNLSQRMARPLDFLKRSKQISTLWKVRSGMIRLWRWWSCRKLDFRGK